MMLDKKGQALVEFVLVLPILIMLILAIIDFSQIFINQSNLEVLLGDINDIKRDEISYDTVYNVISKNDNNIILSLNYEEDDYITIKLEKKIKLITPFANLVFDNPYSVTVTRTIKNTTVG